MVMGLIATFHRWWGVAFCLLFAMWFASGLVMHVVPFPERREAALPAELEALRATARPVEYDQWTVAGDFDSDRPLNRIALDDDAGTEIYLSARSGHVVLITTRRVRVANYAGSIAHWIYLTPLRHHARLWRLVLWWLSLLGTIGASFGVIVGVAKLRLAIRDKAPAYRGLQAVHHYLGLALAPLIIAWIFSGLLSLGEAWPLRGLHRLDFPPLDSHPLLRTVVITALCLAGLAFSFTGVVLAWRRVRQPFPR
jgi:hypothetical protein